MSCPINRYKNMSGYNPSSRTPVPASEMEKRLAELTAARSSQETKLGIAGGPRPHMAAPSGFPAPEVIGRATLSQTELEARMAALNSARVPLFDAPAPSSMPAGIMATDSRTLAPTSATDMDARVAQLNRMRDSQNTDFANLVRIEGEPAVGAATVQAPRTRGPAAYTPGSVGTDFNAAYNNHGAGSLPPRPAGTYPGTQQYVANAGAGAGVGTGLVASPWSASTVQPALPPQNPSQRPAQYSPQYPAQYPALSQQHPR